MFTIATSWAAKIQDKIGLQIAQTSNIYALGLTLVPIWAKWKEPDYSIDDVGGFMLCVYLFFVFGFIKVGTPLLRKLVESMNSEYSQIRLVSLISSVTFAVTLFLATFWFGMFNILDFGEGYSKLVTACVIISALSMSILVLVTYSLEGFRRRDAKHATAAPVVANQQFTQQQSASVEVSPQNAAEAPVGGSQTKFNGPKPQHSVTIPQINHANGNADWPVYPNGLPLASLPNGRPDYQSLHYVASVFMESEKQWSHLA